ncbi:MAG: L-threonylcarbamoyladenylate synthase [Bacillota bacterium]
MKTEILKIDINDIDIQKIRYAADVLRQGGLVAFPTETVYGLGADALNEKAVKKIFEAKGRPSDNPLIVHIEDSRSINELVSDIPSNASILMDRFWPGPLTLVMKKSKKVPEIITAGLSTVAIRVPSHPIALALIREAGLPVAAPSANVSGKPSPTAAKHVIDDLSGKVDVIIEGGSANIGVESTVIDITLTPPVILRPGGISPEQLGNVLGGVAIDPAVVKADSTEFVPRSPGMKYTHYSPKAEVIVVEGEPLKVAKKIAGMIEDYKENGISVGVLSTEQTKDLYLEVPVISLGDRLTPETIAANLFKAFRDFDDIGIKIILAEAIDNTGIGLAVMNRMKKAAGYNIVKIT